MTRFIVLSGACLFTHASVAAEPPPTEVAPHEIAVVLEGSTSKLGLTRLELGSQGLIVSKPVTAPDTAGLLGSGLIVLGIDDTTIVIPLDENATLNSVANQITQTSNLSAQVIEDLGSYRLFVAFNRDTTDTLSALSRFSSEVEMAIAASL